MCRLSYMGSTLLFTEKLTVLSLKLSRRIAIYMDLFHIDGHEQKYPEGFKYSWIAFDIENEQNRVLFDCHPPKGPHVHINDLEIAYDWISLEKAEEDFWDYVNQEFGPLEEVLK